MTSSITWNTFGSERNCMLFYNQDGIKIDLTCRSECSSKSSVPQYSFKDEIILNGTSSAIYKASKTILQMTKEEEDYVKELKEKIKNERKLLGEKAKKAAAAKTKEKTNCCTKFMAYFGYEPARETMRSTFLKEFKEYKDSEVKKLQEMKTEAFFVSKVVETVYIIMGKMKKKRNLKFIKI